MKKIKLIAIIVILANFILLVFLNTFLFKSITSIEVNRIKTNKNVVMLTFDDGPNESDDKILDILENNNVHATFFEIGEGISKYHFTDQSFIDSHQFVKQYMEDSEDGAMTKTIKKIISNGNTIGNHSFTHSKYNKDPQILTDEIIKTNELIQEIYKENNIIISTNDIPLRMPYLQYFPGIEKAVTNSGINNVVSGYLGTDYMQEATGKEKILKQYKSHLKKGIIYCCHSRDYATEWLGTLINWLKEKNYNDFATFNIDSTISYSYKNYGKLVK